MPTRSQQVEENQSCLADVETATTATDEDESCSSYSLQECINELHARRIRQISTQSREVAAIAEPKGQHKIGDGPHQVLNEDLDLIKQNLHNKAQERKCKPCQNGFCYCFTSDSGESAAQRQQQQKRTRKSETQQLVAKKSLPVVKQKTTTQKPQLTAVSRLETSDEHAPLIHIIQELRNNCVVSEVRVNRHKLGVNKQTMKLAQPESITSERSPSTPEAFMCSTSMESSLHSNEGKRQKHKSAGRLLEKRLSRLPANLTGLNTNKPPPKPPRQRRRTASLSTLDSTTPSVREAQDVIQHFLLQRGVVVNRNKQTVVTKSTQTATQAVKAAEPLVDVKAIKRTQRKSFPLTRPKPLPSCPSLSDLERVAVEAHKSTVDYEKNLKATTNSNKSPVKQFSIGWNEPKIAEMLNSNKQFQSQGVQAAAQSKPHKVDLDTVDSVGHNLAANIGYKKTPIKHAQLKAQSPCSVSNLKCTQFSRDFLQKSKRKILRLVSPKKQNKIVRQCTVAVQTAPTTPPGSYHSPINVSTTLTSPTTTTTSSSQDSHFDFTRTVQSPKVGKKPTHGTSYRSFHSDMDVDVNFSKMSHILSNIRLKLEASDMQANRTFQEIERREQMEAGFDVVDGPLRSNKLVQETSAEIRNDVIQLYQRAATAPPLSPEPIYSEIEEESIVIKGSPHRDNKTGIQHFFAKEDPNAIYTQVKKAPRLKTAKSSSPMSLAQFLQNLSPIAETATTMPTSSSGESDPACPPLASSEMSSMPSAHSLNNIRVMEHESPPRVDRNLSKSDISLQRSEMFLENLCQSELQLEKINNLEQSFASNGSYVSYEMPENDLSFSTDSHMYQHQSTPKSAPPSHQEEQLVSSSPEVFTTKTNMSAATRRKLLFNAEPSVTPLPSHTQSLNCTSTRKRIKQVLRESLRKSCNLIKFDRKILSKSLNMSTVTSSAQDFVLNSSNPEQCYTTASSYDLDALFATDSDAPVTQQIVKAVAICRQLPELEVSAEMVEAERLLLCATLKNDVSKNATKSPTNWENRQLQRLYFIDGLRLAIRQNASQDIFFNYFYIVTFMCGGVIRSTQTAECCNEEAIFTDCGLEFSCTSLKTDDNLDGDWSQIHGEIFMLRLRKVSTLSLEPKKSIVQPNSDGSSTGGEIVSRFRLHATFTLNAQDFKPYEYVDSETRRSDAICLRTTACIAVPLQQESSSSNLMGYMQLLARVEARFPKHRHSGLLNVQEPQGLHHWNQRWCVLEGLHLSVWRDANHIESAPIIMLDLRAHCEQYGRLPLSVCAREVCARQRSFALPVEQSGNVTLLFAAETQTELDKWLEKLNAVLQFISNWML